MRQPGKPYTTMPLRATGTEMFFTSLAETDSVNHVGGKVANLSKVQSLGIQIPHSIVLERKALTSFLTKNELHQQIENYLASFSSDENVTLQSKYSDLCDVVCDGSVPAELEQEILDFAGPLLSDSPFGLAIRSSAVLEDSSDASFAGVFETYLAINNLEDVLDRIILCWCSLWSPQAVRYTNRMGQSADIDGMALLLQKMIPAESSGLLYTANPTSGNPREFVVHATFGLSIDLMSGSGMGDTFDVEWNSGKIIRQQITCKHVIKHLARDGIQDLRLPDDEANTPSMTEDQVSEVAALARQLDEKWSRRLDIEWVICQGQVCIVQVRPQTALPTFFPTSLTEEDKQKTWQRQFFVRPL